MLLPSDVEPLSEALSRIVSCPPPYTAHIFDTVGFILPVVDDFRRRFHRGTPYRSEVCILERHRDVLRPSETANYPVASWHVTWAMKNGNRAISLYRRVMLPPVTQCLDRLLVLVLCQSLTEPIPAR